MKVHDLKTDPDYFAALVDGRKKFELRKNDRGFCVGDTLLLREFDRGMRAYSGRDSSFVVTYILIGPIFGLRSGHCIMGLRP